LYIIPYTNVFFDEFNKLEVTDNFDKFEYLNDKLFNYMVQKSIIEPIAYVEVEYNGGTGGQSAIMIKNEKIIIDVRFTDSGYGAVNLVLKEFGIHRESNLDEWDTVRMLRHRNTDDWLEDALEK
jgi:hypothetical protein